VRDHDQLDTAPVQLFQQAYDVVAGGAVQIAGRLVGQDHGRLHDRGARNRDPLALAA
jgi:hypothetical protein